MLQAGIEPATSPLSGALFTRRTLMAEKAKKVGRVIQTDNYLSEVLQAGIEPATFPLSGTLYPNGE